MHVHRPHSPQDLSWTIGTAFNNLLFRLHLPPLFFNPIKIFWTVQNSPSTSVSHKITLMKLILHKPHSFKFLLLLFKPHCKNFFAKNSFKYPFKILIAITYNIKFVKFVFVNLKLLKLGLKNKRGFIWYFTVKNF